MARRLRITRAGGFFIAATVAIGLAAINTGNNLLYLLLGGALGFIALSGWLSEQALRRVEVVRRVPGRATAGEATRIVYEVSNRKRRLPSLALEILEPELPGARAFLASVPPRRTGSARLDIVFHRRGSYVLHGLELATSFPFGFFTKSRTIRSGGSILVWPRHDMPVREPRPIGSRALRHGAAVTRLPGGGRGEFRGLREYRPGDDPRDVHWPSTARAGEPVVREYERDEADTIWICLDPRPSADADAERIERAVETAAALAALASHQGQRFGLATSDATVQADSGPAQLERVLDALAVARFGASLPRPALPGPAESCVLVTAGADDPRFGDRFVVE